MSLFLSILLLAASGDVPRLLDQLPATLEAGDTHLAIDCIERLGRRYSTLDDARLQTKVVKALEKCLARPGAGTSVHETVLRTCPALGDKGEKLALKALKMKHIEASPEGLAAALQAVGHAQSPARVKLLTSYLRKGDPVVASGAIRSLGQYVDAKEGLRKDIVETLVRAYVAAGRGRKNTNYGQAGTYNEEFVAAVRPAYEAALGQLTGATGVRGATGWDSWYRDNAKRRWEPRKPEK